MLVRPVVEQDFDALVSLYQHYERPQPMAITDDFHRRWKELLLNPAIRCMVVLLDGRIVSTCTLVLIPNLAGPGKRYGLIEHVITHPDHRKRGFGTAVLREALALAWREECYKVMLMTGTKRQETLRFYQRAGFVLGERTGLIARPPTETG